MARRKSTRGSKIQPAAMTLTFATPDTAGGRYYIDLSQAASLANRRFYRQGINWAVAGIKVISSKAGTFSIGKLPNTWVLSNAWEKMFRAWQRQQREVLEDGNQQSVRAKFNDFKIFADEQHLTSGVSSNLLPLSYTGTAATPGDWEISQIVIPNFGTPGNNYEPYITAVGDDVGGAGGSISMIKAYQNSRGVPQSPDPAVPGTVLSTDNFLNLMFDVGDNNTDVLANVVGKNDQLPYNQDEYPGGAVDMEGLEWHDIVTLYESNATNGVGSQRVKGGNFPCGLIAIDWTPEDAANVVLQIDLVPGNHRGYLCEPMTEM